MKLTNELKKRIDDYFDNISSDELVDELVEEFNFTEITKNQRPLTPLEKEILDQTLNDTIKRKPTLKGRK